MQPKIKPDVTEFKCAAEEMLSFSFLSKTLKNPPIRQKKKPKNISNQNTFKLKMSLLRENPPF